MDISISSLSLEIPPSQQDPLPAERGLSQEAEQSTGQAVELPVPEQWQEPVDFIAMVSLVLEHDVPQLEMEPSTGLYPHPLQEKNMYVSYSLGEGASSFLELHAMRQNINLEGRLFQKGDRVALKRSFVERFDNGIGVSPQQYDFIKRELGVFCHPRLRSHENICKLLFVGWESYTPAPALGLELAEYGTLKDLLFDADLSDHGSLGTHLVLDLALGLQALHNVGIVHGDVKTGNVLVFAHPRRNVVAKLADFSDSVCLAENEGTWAPLGGTHSWRAPECYGDVEYDLKKTDVYSFGLCALAILAQGIWYSNANIAGLGDCFLVRIKGFNGKTKHEIQKTITSWKRDPQNLVLRLGMKWAEAFAVGHAISKKNAIFVVSAALWREPGRRETMDTIIAGQFELLGSIDEQQRYDEYMKSRNASVGDEADAGRQKRGSPPDSRMVSIGSKSLRDRHFFFKKRMLGALEKIASLALDLDFSEVEDILEHPTELNYFDLLFAASRSSTPIVPTDNSAKNVARAIEAAAQVAEAYSIGFGADQDLLIARTWLAVSARAGRLDHAIYFSVVDDALGHSALHQPAVAQRNLWLVLTASGGCTETSRILRDRYPDFDVVAKRIQMQSGGILRNVRNPEKTVGGIADRLEDKGLPIDHQFPPTGYTILHFAIAFGHEGAVEGILDEGANVNSVDFLGYTPLLLAASCGKGNLVKVLLQRSAEPRIGHDLFNYTPLHFLSYVEDESVESLAEAMVRDAEQLNVISSERGKVGLENPFQSLWGSPLHWAASKPNERLFSRLLKLHQSLSTMPVDLNLVLDTLSSMYHYSMLDLLLPLVPKLRSSGCALNPSELDRLLLNCIRDVSGMQHIMIHRGAFEEAQLKTLDVLLKAGANPFRLSARQLNDSDNVLQLPVVADELQVLKRIVSFGEKHEVDIKAVFEDTARFSGRNAFQRSIYCRSWRVFEYLAQSPYIDIHYTSERGKTALHAAAIQNDTRFIDVLLGLGCDPYARGADGSTPFQSAIFFKAFASASRLLQPDACTPERLFAATPEACNPAGFTLFGSVISAALTNHRHTVGFASLRYLESVGAFTFTNNILHHTDILDLFAKQYPSIRPDYEAFDRALLEYLLARAPAGVLDQHDEYGLAPLHWMVMRGNLPAITTVLTHPRSRYQIDVNLETLEAQPTQGAEISSNPGKTALNLAFLRRHQIPDFIKNGGERELRQWHSRTEAIIEVLQAAGAAMGGESSEQEWLEAMGANVVQPGDDVLGSLLAPVLGQRFRAKSSSHNGAWPLRLAPSRRQSNEGIEDDTLVDGNNEKAEESAGIEGDAEGA